MFERFTHKARAIVVAAQDEARAGGVHYVGTEHLVMGMLAIGEGRAYDALHAAGVTLPYVRAEAARLVGGSSGPLGDEDAEALRSVGIDLEEVVRSVERSFGTGALEQAGGDRRRSGHIPFTKRSKKALELALREALRLRNDYIGTEHVLLGLIREADGIGMKVLANAGVDVVAMRDRMVADLGEAKPEPKRRLGIFAGSVRLTPGASDAITRAGEEATRMEQQHVRPEHILLALADGGIGPAYRILTGAGLTATRVREAIMASAAPPEAGGSRGPGRSSLTPSAKRVLALARGEARRTGGNVGPEHLLIGVLSQDDGLAPEIARQAGLTSAGVRADLRSELGKAA
jgi:ATP-dependent Clp protease ATP-binding subunit ClpA